MHASSIRRTRSSLKWNARGLFEQNIWIENDYALVAAPAVPTAKGLGGAWDVGLGGALLLAISHDGNGDDEPYQDKCRIDDGEVPG